MKERKPRAGSLSDSEVGIIRNLLAQGVYKSQDILDFINTVRRQNGDPNINGGRISDVKTGKPRYDGVMAASDDETSNFMALARKPTDLSGAYIEPLSGSTLAGLFSLRQDGGGCLDLTETDQIECKESFGGQYWMTNSIKAIAAFANNRGGYIAFGVKDNSWEVVGIKKKKFQEFDRRELNQVLRSSFSGGIDFDMSTHEVGGKDIGVLYIYPAKLKPVLFIKQVDNVAEGQIYFRYQGENRLIGPSELQQIIEERIRALSETILSKYLGNILDNGIDNSAVLNLNTGTVDEAAGSFVLDESILPKISFVKEGEFIERSGAPALKLVGEVKRSGKIVAVRDEALITMYPYTWTELIQKVKKAVPSTTQSQITQVITESNMKFEKKFSAFNFRNKKQSDKYDRTGVLPSGTPSIYNDSAITFILEKLDNQK